MKVKDVMNPNVVFCKPDNTVREAAKILKENNISGAPILEGGELVGIISEADLLKLLIVPEKGDLWLPSPFEVIEIPIRELIGWEETKRMLSDVGSTKIEEIMTKDVHTISSEASVEGMITRGDIIKGLAKL